MAIKGSSKTHKKYYGRKRSFRRTLLLILLCIILLVGGAIGFMVSKGYIISTESGFRFDFPFLRPGSQQPEPPVTPPKEPQQPEEKPKEPEVKPEPEPEPEPTAPLTQGLEGDLTRLGDSDYVEQLLASAQAQGCNTLFFTVKGPNGKVLIPTDSAIANQVGSTSAVDGVSAGLQRLKAGGMHLTARLSVSRDNIAPRALRENALKTQNGSIWLDYDRITWFSAAGAQTGEYVVQLGKSCKDLGFDGLLLVDLGYPPRGKTQLIATDKDADKPALVATLVGNIRSQLGADMTLSVQLSETAAAQLTDAATGHAVAQLQKVCDYLVVDSPDTTNQTLQTLRDTVESAAEKTCRVLPRLPAGTAIADRQQPYLLQS